MQLIVYDGHNRLKEAIASIYPATEVQACIVHQIRHSIKYVASKDQKVFMADLKPVYQAVSKDEANIAWSNWRKSATRSTQS